MDNENDVPVEAEVTDVPTPEASEPDAPESFEDRSKLFLAKYGALVEKYKVDFISYPMWQPDGTSPGGWKMVLQVKTADTSNMPVASPFVAQ